MSRHRAEATQTRYPWRATLRTGFAVIVALAAMLPFLVNAAGLDETAPVVGGVLAVAAAITRVLALPAVEEFLERFVPWLSAEPAPTEAERQAAAERDGFEPA